MSQAPLMIQRSCQIPVPVSDCFAIFSRLKPNEFIHSDLVIEPIIKIDRFGGNQFTEVGDVQRITFKSGASIEEELLAFIPGRQFVYRGTGFTQPLLSWLDHAKGSFEFEGLGDETRVTWRYTFYLRDGLGQTAKRAVFNALVVNGLWNRLMNKTLVNLKQIVTLRALKPARKTSRV